jgi:hypothetical protein
MLPSGNNRGQPLYFDYMDSDQLLSSISFKPKMSDAQAFRTVFGESNNNETKTIIKSESDLFNYKFEDRLFLWYWMDTNEIMNRWGVIETTMDRLQTWKEKDYVWEFVEDCILNNEVYFINLDTEKKFVVGWKCDVKELVNYD